MLVKQILSDTMRMVGRADVAESSQSSSSLTGEEGRIQSAMLLCLNAVVDELARGYFPLKTSQTLSSASGEYPFSDFDETPYRILRVTSEGREVKWRCQPAKLVCESPSVQIEYEYVPAAFALSDEFAYPHPSVGDWLVKCGVAAEYMLIAGDIDGADAWESKYRAEIDRQLALLPVKGRIPSRRWL